MTRFSRRTNAFSIDLEEWYHAELIKNVNSSKISRIEPPTSDLLVLLKKYDTKATFFIVGKVAEDNPELIKKIHAAGHEIALHGYTHSRLCEIGPQGFRAELKESIRILKGILSEDLQIKGYRAPSFSLNQKTRWAVDILQEFRIKYDSSVFPARNFLYGENGAPIDIYKISSRDIRIPDETSGLIEFPITVFSLGRLRLPVSGGFYLRLLPVSLQISLLKLVNKKRPFIIYLHPWECFKDTPRVKLRPLYHFITYHNINSTLKKIEHLLKSFKFDRVDNILGI